MLALSVGSRKLRLPDWQLDPVRLQLTQALLRGAPDVYAWTLFHTISEPPKSLRTLALVDAVPLTNINQVATVIFNAPGVRVTGLA